MAATTAVLLSFVAWAAALSSYTIGSSNSTYTRLDAGQISIQVAGQDFDLSSQIASTKNSIERKFTPNPPRTQCGEQYFNDTVTMSAELVLQYEIQSVGLAIAFHVRDLALYNSSHALVCDASGQSTLTVSLSANGTVLPLAGPALSWTRGTSYQCGNSITWSISLEGSDISLTLTNMQLEAFMASTSFDPSDTNVYCPLNMS